MKERMNCIFWVDTPLTHPFSAHSSVLHPTSYIDEVIDLFLWTFPWDTGLSSERMDPKCGSNILLNRLRILNRKMNLNWFNLSLDSYKIKCKMGWYILVDWSVLQGWFLNLGIMLKHRVSSKTEVSTNQCMNVKTTTTIIQTLKNGVYNC
jgi:hypothetical protein